ncbi:MAG TPA: hypothetical protein DD611_00970 [Alphaproteobacteria bacterium]|nr:hypothetical protein [Alphaproteobacteria bacterium]
MKIKFSIMGVFMMLLFMPPNNAIAIDECNTAKVCSLLAQTECLEWCCPNGDKGYDCPSGWVYDEILDGCRHLIDTGADSTGYYTQNYGTCDVTTFDCFEPARLATSTITCERVKLLPALCPEL